MCRGGEILRAVAAGETVQAADNGQVGALILPPGGDTMTRLTEQRQARAARRPVGDLSTIHRSKAQHTTAEMVADTRGEW